MPVLDLYLARRATYATLGTLLVLWPLIVLASLDRAVAKNAIIALRPWHALSAAIISSAPVVLPLAAGGGAAWFAAWLNRDDVSTALHGSMRAPWTALRWVLLPAFVASIASFMVLEAALPRVVAWVDEAEWVEEADIPLALERLKGFGNGQLVAAGSPGENNSIARFFAAVKLPTACMGLAAETARATLDAERQLELHMRNGALDIDRGHSLRVRDLCFDRAELVIGSGLWIPRSPWRSATSRSWSELAGDVKAAASVVGPRARRVESRYGIERPFRIAVSLMPLLLALHVSLLSLRRSLSPGVQSLLAFGGATFISSVLLATAKSMATTAPGSSTLFLVLAAVLPVPVLHAGLRLLERRA